MHKKICKENTNVRRSNFAWTNVTSTVVFESLDWMGNSLQKGDRINPTPYAISIPAILRLLNKVSCC